jgi:hypothetical protein
MRLRRIALGFLLLPLAGIVNAQMMGGSANGPLPANAPVVPTTIKNAPFSAVVVTEYDRVMGNGNHIHRETRGKVFRDDQGRVRTENEFATPGSGGGGEQYMRVTILDPVQHTVIHLDPRTKVATVAHTGQTVATADAASAPKHGTMIMATPLNGSNQPAGPPMTIQTQHGAAVANAGVKTETLGTKSIEGVETVGTKTTRTIATGSEPIISVTDSWYSRDLQIMVLSETNDGPSGHNSMKLMDIVRAEPNSQLFLIPQDYTVKESNPATASAKP